MKPVEIVTINKLIPIYKNGEEAHSIEVARIIDQENNQCQFNIIVGKGLYQIGDECVYIQPDYCIPDNELFKEYIEPNENKSLCKLGKKNRIKAIKFNFQFENEIEPIYSNGILLHKKLVDNYINKEFDKLEIESSDELGISEGAFETASLQEQLCVIKYEADDSHNSMNKGLVKGDLIHEISISDEPRIENMYERVNRVYDDGEILSCTLKRDGSAIYNYVILGEEERYGVCSRKQEKKLEQQYVSAYKDGNVILHKYYNRETAQHGWYNDFTQKFFTDDDVKDYEPIVTILKDAWVDTVNEYNYLNKLRDYAKEKGISLELKGELCGEGVQSKKNNLDSKGKKKVIWYGVNSLKDGHFVRNHYGDEINLKTICDELQFEYTEELWEGRFTYDEIIKKCNDYFKMKEDEGILVEGIVIRTKYSNRLSVKYLSSKYDANN